MAVCEDRPRPPLSALAPSCMTIMGNDCACNYDLWSDFVAAIQKECVPSTTCGSIRQRISWVTHTIIKEARIKRALFKKADQISLPCCHRANQRALKAAVHIAHQEYIQKIASKTYDSPNVFWVYIRRLRSSSQRPCFSPNGAATDSPPEIANLIARLHHQQ